MDAKHYIMTDPAGIESRSFEIIAQELGPIQLDPAQAPIIKRVVHTTADFEYARLLDFHPQAIAAAHSALSSGCGIYTDTRMIIAGANKTRLSALGCSITTLVDDADVAAEAARRSVTRSIVGIEHAAAQDNIKIYAIGNAPTALVRLVELVRSGQAKPALIIGVPVGFVGAAESKELLPELGIPYIAVKGRKGGSPVAAAIINALLLGMASK